MDKQFQVNKDKCISCGLCVKDCSTMAIKMGDDNKPYMSQNGNSRCMACQHCLAICPVGAISIQGKNAENSTLYSELSSEQTLLAIKNRRSCRNYKTEDVSLETIEKLKEMLNYVPTGRNNHNLLFSITNTRKETDVIRDIVCKKLLKLIRFFPFSLAAKKYSRYTKLLKNGTDIIFRNAPHVIVACSPIDAPCADVDPIIALSYFELYANSLGLGTCWCGLAQNCFKIIPEMKKFFNIPKGYKPVYVMLFGYPSLNYTRHTQPIKYTFVSPNSNCIN